jgi:hypothetical protein
MDVSRSDKQPGRPSWFRLVFARLLIGELKLVTIWFAVLLGLALVLSAFAGQHGLIVPIVLNFIAWTVLGFLFTLVALVKGVREFHSRTGVLGQ